MIQIVATDMDGTLLNSQRKISPKTKEALKLAKAQGVKIVISTGRPLNGIWPYAEELGLIDSEEYAIAFNGAVVYNLATKQPVVSYPILGKDIKYLAKIAHDNGLLFHAFSEKRGLLGEVDNQWTDVEKNYNNISITLIDFLKDIEDSEIFYKILFCGVEEKIDAIQKKTQSLKDRFTIVKSMPFFLEFLNVKASKGKAVTALAQKLNVPISSVMAFGDAENDEDMIEAAGIGVAMGNGDDKLKQMAQMITDSNDHDGIAKVIHEVVLQNY